MNKCPGRDYPRGTVRGQRGIEPLWRPDCSAQHRRRVVHRFAQTWSFEVEPFATKHQHEQTRKLRRELNVSPTLGGKPRLGRGGRGGRIEQTTLKAAKTYGGQLAEQPGHIV